MAASSKKINREHPLYSTWKSMRTRCNNPNVLSYHNYGGRGIRVCERWNDFRLFVEDMGRKPSPKHQIDRINNNGNYEPSNCRWASRSLQTANQRCKSFSGVKGVYWHEKNKKWIARSDKRDGHRHLGSFAIKEDAILAATPYFIKG